MNYCIEVIIFYIKGYLNTDEFEDLLYDSYAYSARTEQPVRDSGKAVRYKREV